MEITVKCSWAHLFLMQCCLNIDFGPCAQRFLQIRAIAVDDEIFKVFLFLRPATSLTCCQLTWLAAVFLQLVLFSFLPFVALLLRHIAAIKCRMALIFFFLLKMVIRFINHYILSLLYTASQLFCVVKPHYVINIQKRRLQILFFPSKCTLMCQYHRVKLYDIRGLHISSRWGL